MACSSLKQQQQQNNINSYISPRISFSNGFAELKSSSSMIKLQSSDHSATTVAAADFEFCVPTFDMNSADELFFNGKLMPVVEEQKNLGVIDRMKVSTTTLRDELLAGENDDDDDDGCCALSEINEPGFRMKLARMHKGSSTFGCKWKERFSSFKN